MKRISIVLINWNSGEITNDCIESIRGSSYKSYEIIVVDNGSSDDSIQRISENTPDAKILPLGENRGFTGANNAGISYALSNGSDYILILNNDTIVDAAFLENLAKAAQKNPDAFLIGKIYYHSSHLLWYAGSRVNKYTLQAKHIGQGKRDSQEYSAESEVPFISGCCIFGSRDLFTKVGFLDESFFIYSEDLDFSYRARKKGVRILYVPSAILWHRVSYSVKKNTLLNNKGNTSPFQYYLNARNSIYILRKHGTALNFTVGLPLILCSRMQVIFGLMLLRRWPKMSAVIRGVFDGFTHVLQTEQLAP